MLIASLRMRDQAITAVLLAGLCILKISSAFCAQTIQRAVAEQIIKIFKVSTLMAGIVYTGRICKKGMVILSRVRTPRNRRCQICGRTRPGEIPQVGSPLRIDLIAQLFKL